MIQIMGNICDKFLKKVSDMKNELNGNFETFLSKFLSKSCGIAMPCTLLNDIRLLIHFKADLYRPAIQPDGSHLPR